MKLVVLQIKRQYDITLILDYSNYDIRKEEYKCQKRK